MIPVARRLFTLLRQLPYWQLAAACGALIAAVVCLIVIAGSGGPPAVSIATSQAEAEELETPLKVHVAGAVLAPGLYEMEPEARVADALEAAGGPAPDADLAGVNLAARLRDGEKVSVPRVGEPRPAPGSEEDGLISLNGASAAELERIPGIGPVLAQRIIEFREEHGGFDSVQQLRQVDGIGPKKFEDLKDRVQL